VCIALCTIVAQNIAQNRPDNFPSHPQTTDGYFQIIMENECLLVQYVAFTNTIVVMRLYTAVTKPHTVSVM